MVMERHISVVSHSYAANLAREASVPAHRCGLKALPIIA